jgi:AsmA protein
MRKTIVRILKITGITLGSLIALLFLLPMLFPGFVADKVKNWANSAITGELNFSRARLSFFNHFPALTLTLHDFSLKGSAPFQKDTLASAKELALGIDLGSLFSDKISIDQVYLTKGKVNILVNEKGEANYNVYQGDTTTTSKAPSSDSGSASLKIDKIQIDHVDLVYSDRSIPMLITALDFNYLGKGDLSKAVFDLQSRLSAASFSFAYDGKEYVKSKKLNADLVTKINTSSLAFVFEKNDLRLNTLPVKFKGKFEFLDEGYNMEFRLISQATDLGDVFSALPPEYAGWLEKTTIRGKTSMNAALVGQYNVAKNLAPDLTFDLQVRDGFVAYESAPDSVSNLYFDFKAALPGLNTDSLHVDIDSIYFKLDKGYFNSVLHITGLDKPYVYSKTDAVLDLEKWDRAFGLLPFQTKGQFAFNLFTDGKYAAGEIHQGIRNVVDTVITSVPKFNLKATLTNGYFKYNDLPAALQNISFNINAQCADSVYQHITASIDNLNANLLNNFIKGYFHLRNMADYDMDANLQSVLNLADVQQFYPLDSMSLAGHLNMDVQLKGKYIPAKRVMPVATARLSLKDGQVKTKYYPHPIEQIQVDAQIVSPGGNMKTTKVNISPISFVFEGQPFTIKADLQNFDDLRYHVTSAGTVDIGRLYKVFSQKGLDVKGLIRTSLALRGLQSDATAGRYNRLFNSGTLQLQDITVMLEEFPKPLVIKSGTFRFEQDKMWFESFRGNYGSSNFTLKGYLSNVIAYATQPNAPLKGQFDLNSDLVVVDEFTVFADGGAPPAETPAKPTEAATGVVMVPGNLSITFNANVKKVQYNGIDIHALKGQVLIDSAKVKLNQTGFVIAGAPVVMDASYGALSPQRAAFTYTIDAKDFDVKRAYNEIKIFRDLASSASKAEGIISLHYDLAGKLDASMMPVYPTLKGGGVLSLKKVKVSGLKLFSAVGKASGRDSISNPDLSDVQIKSTIANNIITIERTKMKIMGFRPRIEGQVGFDSRLNLKFRLGLPPFGIIGIPMTVTGTSENPKVQMRRGKDSDNLDGTDVDESEGEGEAPLPQPMYN